MIEVIFTIDYEIYGNGQGSLRELVYTPAEKLKDIFLKWDTRFVTFVEVAELEKIETMDKDTTMGLVKNQIRDLYKNGFEIGLHVHPQWFNARYERDKWLLDYTEYNLCTLPEERIEQIIDHSINWLRKILNVPAFIPISFRAGNWLLQPTQTIASILADRNIKIDSSVFKGGYQYKYHLDYRRSRKNGYYWKFNKDVNIPDQEGILLEVPTYTKMVFPWQMLTKKRVGLQKKASSANVSLKSKLDRFRDFIRIKHPLKFDFCRMTIDELTAMLAGVIKEDQEYPSSYKPIVAIGHTKDLTDFETVEQFLELLINRNITISTFKEVYKKC